MNLEYSIPAPSNLQVKVVDEYVWLEGGVGGGLTAATYENDILSQIKTKIFIDNDTLSQGSILNSLHLMAICMPLNFVSLEGLFYNFELFLL